MSSKPSGTIFNFAYFPSIDKAFQDLKSLTIDEYWGELDNKILKNYIEHTFRRLNSLHNEDNGGNKWMYFDPKNRYVCFNTGLYTKNYNQIFAYFTKNNNANRQAWYFNDFIDEANGKIADIIELPIRAKYFSDIKDLIFDTSCQIRIDLDHILDDANNKARIPDRYKNNSNLRVLLEGAINQAKKRISANYNLAVPQFFDGSVQFLIPISLDDTSRVDLVLAVKRLGEIYRGNTCLTMEMAYNNARLIVKPEAPWLRKNTE
jgi:hypothetical protein